MFLLTLCYFFSKLHRNLYWSSTIVGSESRSNFDGTKKWKPNRIIKVEIYTKFYSPCEPLISNVLHRVFLLFPMIMEVFEGSLWLLGLPGSFHELLKNWHLRAGSQIVTKCRQISVFRTTHTLSIQKCSPSLA